MGTAADTGAEDLRSVCELFGWSSLNIRGSWKPGTCPNPNAPSTRATSHSPTNPTATLPAILNARGRVAPVAAKTGFSGVGVDVSVVTCSGLTTGCVDGG